MMRSGHGDLPLRPTSTVISSGSSLVIRSVRSFALPKKHSSGA